MGNVKGDKNFKFIKELIDNTIPYKKNIILFGSRSGNKYESSSDYDIFVVVEESVLKRRELVDFQIRIKRMCAKRGIDIDLIIRDRDYSDGLKDYPGNIVNSALSTGISF